MVRVRVRVRVRARMRVRVRARISVVRWRLGRRHCDGGHLGDLRMVFCRDDKSRHIFCIVRY